MGMLLERLRQGHRTMAFPDGAPPEMPDRWRGEPVLNADVLRGGGAATYCPTGALDLSGEPTLDLGRCLFCGACFEKGPAGGVSFSRKYAMCRFSRDDLRLGRRQADSEAPVSLAADERRRTIRALFGRSLKLRQVSAGGCNACEADSNVLNTLAWDLSRFGISFVASPRHADGLLVTGPVTDNMKLALEKTYAAVPSPKVVIAVGACAISGGIYGDGTGKGILDGIMPVDAYVPDVHLIRWSFWRLCSACKVHIPGTPFLHRFGCFFSLSWCWQIGLSRTTPAHFTEDAPALSIVTVYAAYRLFVHSLLYLWIERRYHRSGQGEFL